LASAASPSGGLALFSWGDIPAIFCVARLVLRAVVAAVAIKTKTVQIWEFCAHEAPGIGAQPGTPE
jgi:hypothetical protein